MFHSEEPLIVSELIKIMTTVSNVMLEVYIYCYLFEHVDAKVGVKEIQFFKKKIYPKSYICVCSR